MAAGDRSGRGGDCVYVWISPLLFVDMPDFVRICGVHGFAGILSRGESDSRAVRGFVYGIGGGPDQAQYEAFWRVEHFLFGGVVFFCAWPAAGPSASTKHNKPTR